MSGQNQKSWPTCATPAPGPPRPVHERACKRAARTRHARSAAKRRSSAGHVSSWRRGPTTRLARVQVTVSARIHILSVHDTIALSDTKRKSHSLNSSVKHSSSFAQPALSGSFLLHLALRLVRSLSVWLGRGSLQVPVHMPQQLGTRLLNRPHLHSSSQPKVNPSLLAPAITRGSLCVPLASSGLSARGCVCFTSLGPHRRVGVPVSTRGRARVRAFVRRTECDLDETPRTCTCKSGACSMTGHVLSTGTKVTRVAGHVQWPVTVKGATGRSLGTGEAPLAKHQEELRRPSAAPSTGVLEKHSRRGRQPTASRQPCVARPPLGEPAWPRRVQRGGVLSEHGRRSFRSFHAPGQLPSTASRSN